jgi:peptidoglycan hydrolase-like protein with peptidoglycan-binding domain
MRIAVFGVVALSLLTAACGSDESQRAATGGLTGVGVGAAVGGPVGAVVGGVVGAGGGAALPEGADTVAENALHKKQAAGSSHMQQVKQAQTELQREGLYDGKIDGIVGPKTKQALTAFQQREGLQQTARLDRDTRQRLAAATGSAATAQNSGQNTGNAPAESSGTSTPRAALSPSELRGRLQQQGYNNIADLNRNSDNSWSARAQLGDRTLDLRVDGQTGRVLSQRDLAAATSPAPPRAGDNAAPAVPPAAAPTPPGDTSTGH